MELITILNSCHRFRGFVYQHAHFSADKKSIEVALRTRKGSAAVCSRCHLPAPGYDQSVERFGYRKSSIHEVGVGGTEVVCGIFATEVPLFDFVPKIVQIELAGGIAATLHHAGRIGV